MNATRAAYGLEPIEGICSTCRTVGTCLTPQACERPVADLKPIRRRLFTSARSREQMGRIVGASLGLAGCAYIAFHVARAWGLW